MGSQNDKDKTSTLTSIRTRKASYLEDGKSRQHRTQVGKRNDRRRKNLLGMIDRYNTLEKKDLRKKKRLITIS